MESIYHRSFAQRIDRKPAASRLFVQLLWLVSSVALLGLSGCQPLPDPARAAPDQFVPDADTARGQLAYIGGDGNIYVTDAARTQTKAITEDATVYAEGSGRSYHRIAWAPDGHLAFAAVERGRNRTRSQLYAAAPGEPVRLLGQSDEHFVIYIHWAPQLCPQQTQCRRLAYLIEEADSIALRLVELTATEVSASTLGRGRPFYFSWSPDGTRMIWHTGGSRRYNPDAQLSLYDIAAAKRTPLTAPPGLFLAPHWSPGGTEWLDIVEQAVENDAGTEGEDGQAISGAEDATFALRRASATSATPLVTVPHDAAFAWSPDGTRIAYAARRHGDDPFLGPIHVIDVADGTVRRITDVGLHVTAFFWSPDGTRLAYINRLALPDESWSQWRVYNVQTDRDRGFAAFNPSAHMRTLFGSFNQYAQSHRVWSPDGRYLVYADRDPALIERIWLVDTHAPKGTDPLFVSEGAIGIWSWN